MEGSLEGVCRLLALLTVHHSKEVRRAALAAVAGLAAETTVPAGAASPSLVGRLAEGLSWAMSGGAGPGVITVRKREGQGEERVGQVHW